MVMNAANSVTQITADGRAGLDAQNTALAINTMMAALKEDNTSLAMDMMTIYETSAHANAQGLQASRILSNTPEGKAVKLSRGIQQMENSARAKYGNQFNGYGITPEMIQDYYDAQASEDKKSIRASEKAIAGQVAKNTPIAARFMGLLDEWRYVAMLTNTRTHMRNILGNTAQILNSGLKNLYGTAIESVFVKKGQRTKAIITPKDFTTYFPYFSETFSRVADGALGSRKLGANGDSLDFLNQGYFKNNFNDKILNAEDRFFQYINFTLEGSMYAKANGWTVEFLQGDTAESRAALNRTIAYAEEQAIKNTFRDDSKAANAISQIAKQNNALGFIVRSTMPFVKTPINIVRRGIEYSPIGVANGIKQLLVDVPKGKVTATQAIDTMSAGLAGSTITALGYMLAKAGILVGTRGDDKKEKDFDTLQGGQDYSIKIGDTYYSLSWLMPTAIPLFLGVELGNADTDGNVWDKIKAFGTSMLGPLVDLSVLQGIENVLNAGQYGENTFIEVGRVMLENYIGQMIPSELGNIARMIDPTRRDPYKTEAESGFQRDLEIFWNRLKSRIPFASQTVEPYIDAWGREDTATTGGENAWNIIENLISPGYASTRNETEVDQFIQSLYDGLNESAYTGASGVLPQRSSVDEVAFGGEKRQLTSAEQTQFARTRGQFAYNTIDSLIKQDWFLNLTQEDQAEIIKNVYSLANTIAKNEIGADLPDGWQGQKIVNLVNQGLSYEDALMYRALVGADGNGSITQEEAQALLDGMNHTDEQKSALWSATNSGWKKNPYSNGGGGTSGASPSGGAVLALQLT